MAGLGAFIGSGKMFKDLIDQAQLAESLGYSSLWVVQVGDREATVVASALAMNTSKIGIGTGVLPTFPRTPAVMAQTAATIDELSGGRFTLGLGTSHKIVIETWHGMTFDRPLAHIREYVAAVRGIFQGKGTFGEIYRTAFNFSQYEPIRTDLPIYLSCLSPKMCRLAGEIADGAILWLCAPEYIEKNVVPAITEGRESAGKTMDDFEIVAAVPVSLTQDPVAARDAFRKVAIIYWSLPFYRAAIERAGLTAALEIFDSQGYQAIPDEAVDTFIGVGDESACREIVSRYTGAGVTIPALSVLPRHEGSETAAETLKVLAPA